MLKDQIAFIGVGRMGGRMATRLLQARYSLVIADPDDSAVSPLVERGATRRSTPAEAAEGAKFILTSLPNPSVLLTALIGDDGALKGADEGALVIDFSTGDPAVARSLADKASAHGVGFLDAPVSRGIVGAENGTLIAMVGGRESDLATARPILGCLASEIVHVGDVGAGQATKLCNNMLTAIITTALGEVLITGVKAGVQLEQLVAALAAGSAGNYVLSGYFPNTLFTQERRAGFSLEMMRKDIGLFIGLAAETELELPLSDLVLERYDRAEAAGLADADSTSIAELYERAAGIRLSLPTRNGESI